MKIVVEFETKYNASDKIIKPQDIKIFNTCGRIEQEEKKFRVILVGCEEEVIEVLRLLWELTFLYDGYFYTPCKYTVDDEDVKIEKLYFLSFYKTGKIWKDCGATLVKKEDKDFSEEQMLRYREFRNKGRESGKLIKSLLNSYYYLHSDAYEKINVNHRLSLLLNICDGFVMNINGQNKNVKANIAYVIGKALDSKVVKHGATMLGIPSNKIYDALMQERHEIDHYIIKDGSISEYEMNSEENTKDYINWYFVYIVELALRVAFLKQIGCTCEEGLTDKALNDINDWLILNCDLPEKCKNPSNQFKQDLKKIGICKI